jgi:hypothetical protein
MNWKIVRTSNFDEENYDEKEINLGLMTQEQAYAVARVLNTALSGANHPDYYRIVDKDYQPKVYDPNA